MIAFSAKTPSQSTGRSKSVLRFVLGLGVALLFTVVAVVGMTQTKAGRAFIETQIKDYIHETYEIQMTYDDSHFYRESGEWRVGVSGLKLQRQSNRPVAFKKLSARLSTLAFWNKAKFRAHLLVEGATIDLSLSPREIKVPSLGLSLRPSELQSFLDEPSDPSRDFQSLASVRWQDIALDLEYGTEATEQWVVASSGEWLQPQHVRALSLKASSLNLAKLLSVMRTFTQQVPKLAELHKSLDKTAVLEAGILDRIRLACEDLAKCEGEFSAEDFSIRGEEAIPGLQGITTHVKLEPGLVTFTLPQSELILNYPYISSDPLPLSLSATAITLRTGEDTMAIHWPRTSFVFDGIAAQAEATFSIPVASPSHLAMAIAISGRGAKLLTVFHRLPRELIGTKVKDWLIGNFSRGDVDDFAVSVEGTLPKTPLVTVKAEFRNAQLRFLDGWPLLNECRGEFQMHGLAMSIPVQSCRSGKVIADQALVKISGIEDDQAEIGIRLRAKSPVKEAFEYLAASPLKSMAEAFLSIPVLGSEQITTLDIRAPLSAAAPRPLQLEGASVLKNVRLAIKGGIYSGESPEIQLKFDKNGLKRLAGVLTSSADQSRVELIRDEIGDYLSGTIHEAVPSNDPLRGTFKILPAKNPEIVTAMITSYKPAQGGASIDFRSLRWHLGQKQSLGIAGRAAVYDLGLLSELFGLKGNFRKGKGSIDFDLTLADLNSKLGAPVIDGDLTFDLKEGEILKLPRTAVSLVDFANLNALGVSSTAMPYDTMGGRLNFSKGKVKVERSTFDLGIIEVRMAGDVNYQSRRLNLTLDIIPNLGSPAAAIAIGIWNPLLGLGLFGLSQLQEKSSDSAINRVISQTYKIEGPIDDSKIHLIRPFNIKAAFSD